MLVDLFRGRKREERTREGEAGALFSSIGFDADGAGGWWACVAVPAECSDRRAFLLLTAMPFWAGRVVRLGKWRARDRMTPIRAAAAHPEGPLLGSSPVEQGTGPACSRRGVDGGRFFFLRRRRACAFVRSGSQCFLPSSCVLTGRDKPAAPRWNLFLLQALPITPLRARRPCPTPVSTFLGARTRTRWWPRPAGIDRSTRRPEQEKNSTRSPAGAPEAGDPEKSVAVGSGWR